MTLIETAARLRHARHAASGLTPMRAFEIACEVHGRLRPGAKTTNGFAVNSRNELVPIRGAITSYENGKPVIARPLSQTPEPKRRRLIPISIDSLVDADGDIDAAAAHEIKELMPLAPFPVAGAEQSDDEPDDEQDAADESGEDIEE